VKELQALVNSICNEFDSLKQRRLPYPKVIEGFEDVYGLTELFQRWWGQTRKFVYDPIRDEIYLLKEHVAELKIEELRETVFHELNHQTLNRKLVGDGICLGAFLPLDKIDSLWREVSPVLFMLMGTLSEHFLDILVDRTLEERHGMKRIHCPRYDRRMLNCWKLGPIEGLAERGSQFLGYPAELQVIYWLVEGVEIFCHSFHGEKECENALIEASPTLYQQLQEIFDGLDEGAKSRVIAERYGSLCKIAALEIGWDYFSPKEKFSKISSIYSRRDYLVPCLIRPCAERVNEVLKCFLSKLSFRQEDSKDPIHR